MYSNYSRYSSGLDTLEIISKLLDSLSTIFKAVAIIVFVIGLLQCLFGYKWIRFVIAVSGFLFGSTIGAFLGIMMNINSSGDVSDVVFSIIATMLVVGGIGAVVSYKVYKFGVFLIGFSGVYIVNILISLAGRLLTGNDNIASIFITSAIPAAIAGWLVVKFTKPIIIIYTSISGAYTASFALSSLISGGGFILMVGLSIAGIYYQCKSNGGLTEKSNRVQPMPAPIPPSPYPMPPTPYDMPPMPNPAPPAPKPMPDPLPSSDDDDALPPIID